MKVVTRTCRHCCSLELNRHHSQLIMAWILLLSPHEIKRQLAFRLRPIITPNMEAGKESWRLIGGSQMIRPLTRLHLWIYHLARSG